MRLSVVDQSPIPAGFTSADALHNSIDLARFTERLGYTRFWIAEHHATEALASPAPEILITRVAAETSRIRVGSGGVLLPHYSALKVAETFRMLHALYPGRIDLGVGRAPGSGRLEAYALQRDRDAPAEVDDFPQKLVEMLAFLNQSFAPDHPFSRIKVSPAMPGGPEVWLLGSSGWSADAAAQLSLPYAAAHFIGPSVTRRSIETYRQAYRPSEARPEPEAIIAIGAICADTEAEAQRLYSSQRLRRLLRDQGDDRGPIPTPEDAIARLAELPDASPRAEGEWPRIVVGDVEQVRDRLTQMAAALQVEELMIITVVHDHEARKRSYALLADAFGLASSPD